MKHWEDVYIAGEKGFWYVVIGDLRAGYFHYLKQARQYVRQHVAAP
jgi:hypothetical protein